MPETHSMKATLRILHLAPHYGGGVGCVVRALITESAKTGLYSHAIGSLETLGELNKKWAVDVGIEVHEQLWDRAAQLRDSIRRADIVHIHWWHHPLLNALMHRSDLPEFRCVLWCHVNGLHPPQNITADLLEYTDQLVLATPASLEIPFLHNAIAEQPERVRVVQSNAGPPDAPDQAPLRHNHHGFRIGYVGTVDYAKMHPDFIPLSLKANIPDAQFIVAGGPSHAAFAKQVAEYGATSDFDVLGPIDYVNRLMATFDVFGYPLSAWHYGTGEQVLIEAMAAGAVPVVLDNSSERYIVEHERTGLVCENTNDYSLALQRLHTDRHLLATLSGQARENVKQQFSLIETVNEWHRIYRESMEQPQRLHSISGLNKHDHALELFIKAMTGTPAERVFSSIVDGNYPEWQNELASLPSTCFAPTRGSPFHYQHFFPDDQGLTRLCTNLRKLLAHQTTEVTV